MFVEIETGKSDVNTNIEKCKVLDGTIVFFFVTNDLRDAWQDSLSGITDVHALTPAELDRLASVVR